jgi:hypothetical protein
MSTDRSLRADNNNRTSGVGTFGNSYIQNQADSDQFNIRTRAFMGNPEALEMLDPNDPDNISAETVKAVHEAALREDRATQDSAENKKTADGFVACHPEYVDNYANAQLLLNQMNTMFGPGLHTADHHEAAYEYLRNNTDFLKLDKTVVAAQQKQAVKQRYADSRAAEAKRITNLSEAELEALPLEEIRRLDAIERQQQLQLAGERGGNGF